MNAGELLREGFEAHIDVIGGPIVIHKHYGSPQQTSHEVRGFKGHDDNNRNQVVFVFSEIEKIERGDVIQIKGARDIWRVTDIEDNIHSGVLVSFRAYVDKEGGSLQQSRSKDASIVVNAPVIGGIQFQSPNSTQTVLISITKIDESIDKLRGLVGQCPASELEKEDTVAALDRLQQLAQKPKSAEVIAKANEKLTLVKNTIGTAVELSKIAAPYIALLANHFAQ